jgi:3-hydroxyanthranilate 3,4-dioxygenase
VAGPTIIDLARQYQQLADEDKTVSVQWQDDTIAFVARGRAYRSEFHINPCEEIIHLVKGEMRLHYRTPEGREEVAEVREGSVVRIPPGVPHSPRRSPESCSFVLERKRRDGEIDRFQWYCPGCGLLLHEESFVVADYRDDPVSQAYRRFFENEAFRTCKACGEVMLAP